MNQMARPPLPHMTTDEFLVWPGDGSRRKFHLIDGKVLAMSPASHIHGIIQARLAQLMMNAIEAAGDGLSVAMEAAIVPALNADDNVRVPDLVVSASNDALHDQIVADPLLIVEILSPGNKPVTRDNIRAYATPGSVREILVVHTSRMELELHARPPGGNWPPEPAKLKPGQRLRLDVVQLDCTVEDVYANSWLIRRARG